VTPWAEVQLPDCPNWTVEGFSPVEVAAGKRLVLADRSRNGRMSTWLHAMRRQRALHEPARVEFVSGEPSKMTVAEKSVLAAKGVTGVRPVVSDHLRERP